MGVHVGVCSPFGQLCSGSLPGHLPDQGLPPGGPVLQPQLQEHVGGGTQALNYSKPQSVQHAPIIRGPH